MKHLGVAIALTFAVVVGAAGIASAASANISPASQTHSHGVQSHWSLSWSGGAPYEVLFDRGNGTAVWWPSTSSTSSSQNYTFWPCVTTKFYQWLEVWTSSGTYANDTSWAKEYGGHPCNSAPNNN
jgi:hypothetical protein